MNESDRERYRRLQDLFHRAIVEPPEALDAFVVHEVGDDPDLRAELERLLAAHRAAEGFLEPPAEADGDETAARPSRIGGRVGVYRLLRPLGHGGMGCVYLAARDDDAFRKRVAIKLLRPEALADRFSEERVRRFHAERQILAGLEHPHIARLLDGGTTDAGLPYLVMEYVEGKPIDVYCDEHRLPTRARLRLFLAVCDAVSFAHRNLVVHRDLKPSNILVKADGTVKLLDFGIAKLLNPELAGPTLAATTLGAQALTPGYASPEQIKGDPISTASDVYSLGVLLYELLSGHRPYRVDPSRPAKMLEAVCEREPPPMSRAVGATTRRGLAGDERELTPETVAAVRDGDPARLRRRLEGDLDTIVAKALRKQPERRYASAERLAEDLERHLGGFPVRARKPTLAYHWGSFARRNRFKVAATASFVLAAVLFGLVMGWQRKEILRQRDRAERVTELLVDLFEVSDPLRTGQDVSAREILDVGAAKITDQLQEEPHVQAELLMAIGVIYRRLALYDRASPLLERALEIRRGFLSEEDEGTADSLDELATTYLEMGKVDAAGELYGQSHEIRRELFGDNSLEVATSINHLGIVHWRQSDYEAAESHFRRALGIRQRLLDKENEDVADTLNNLANVLFMLDEREASVRHHREALRIRRELFGEHHPDVAESLNNLAVMLWHMGDLEKARALYEDALEIETSRYGSEHPTVFETLGNLAAVLEDQGDLEAAEQHFRRILAYYREAQGDRRLDIARTANNLARLRKDQGDLDEARDLYGETIEILREGEDLPRQRLGTTLVALAALEESEGAYELAFALVQEAQEILGEFYDRDDWRRAAANSVLAGCLLGLGHLDRAEALLLQSVPILEAESSSRTAVRYREALGHLAELYQRLGRSEAAERYRELLSTSFPERQA